MCILSTRRLARLLLCLICLLHPTSTLAQATLEPIPELDLSVTGDSAREQLGEQRAVVERLLSESSDPARLAAELGNLGRLYVVYDFLEPARVCFENASRLASKDYRWPYLLGYVRTLQGQLEQAATLFRRALELEPDDLPARVRLGRVELQLGRPEAARVTFEQALVAGDNAAAHEGLGKAARLIGDSEAAVRHLKRALALDPAATAVHYALAQAYRDLRQLEPARAHLELAGDIPARLDDPLINPLASLAESTQFYLAQGAEALENRDYESAAGAFREALERDARGFPAYRGLAISLDRLGDRDGARRAFEQALEQATTDDPEQDRRERAGIHRSLGLLEADAGRGPQALTHYQASLALNGDQADLLMRTGNALARGRHFTEAIAHYDRLLKLEPEWAPVVLEKRATALINLSRGEEAVSDFSRAVEAAPQDASLRLRFARALEFLGDSDAAEVQRGLAERLAVTSRERGPLLLETARRLTRNGDFSAAAERYRDLLKLDPEHREARLALAGVLGHLGRLEEAAREFQQVIAGSPRHAPAHRSLVVTLVLAERYGQARLALQNGLRTFPLNANLALTQVRLLATAPDPAVRDGALALEIAHRLHAERQDAAVREVLALALAVTGEFSKAAELQRELVAVTEQSGKSLETLRSRLAAFDVGKAWTAESPEELLVDLAER